MRVGAIIPVHSYLGQLQDIVNWCIKEYPKLFLSYKIIIVSDLRHQNIEKRFKQLESIEHVSCVFSNHPNSLKHSLIKGMEMLEDVDLINIIEADAIPRLSTLAAMLEVYENQKDAAAVGPMFSWNRRRCYPTHEHWYTDKLVSNSYLRVGEVREVGRPGIPFLFSIWNPTALKEMKNHQKSLPDVYALDGNMGIILHKKYKFYRVLNHDVEHFAGGKNK